MDCGLWTSRPPLRPVARKWRSGLARCRFLGVTAPSLRRIIIESTVTGTEMAAAIRRNAGRIEVSVESPEAIESLVRCPGPGDGKHVLLARHFRGRFLKQCQGLKPCYSCCGLHTVAEGNNCAMECSYCILQYYMTTPYVSVFANMGDLQTEIADAALREPRRIFRITTGELSDSLLFDSLTESTKTLVPFAKGLANVILEIKTKTDNVENLLSLDHGQRVVVSWSVNPPEVIEKEELKTARLQERLRAAAAVSRQGYPVGFHLDPLIHYPSWREGYTRLLDSLLDAVSPERIAWISMGSFRFPFEMKALLESRFPRSRLRYGELVRCADGKMRYLRPIRLEMYRALAEHLLGRLRGAPSVPLLYLCMEPPEVWQRVFGSAAPGMRELDHRFAESYAMRFSGAGLPRPDLA